MTANLSFNLGRKPTKAERTWLKSCEKIINGGVLEIDAEELVRCVAKNMGLGERFLLTHDQMALRRKRSAAAKSGWKTRRKS